uniref:Uncharacterized protein n=1 Tax=Prymnesium polylepis TaxID=72548 RepID=A0A7S4NFY6_9EUKA
MTCPSTSAWVAAGMKLTTTAATSCDKVLAEMKARVAGQYGAWHDPHNNGTYSVQSYGGTFSTSRLTGDGKYTDKQIFTLTTSGDSCVIEACSRSQVTSYLDYGTNYCDVKVLVCGSADGCKPVVNDFTTSGESTEAFAGSSVDLSSCLKVLSKPKASAAAAKVAAKVATIVEKEIEPTSAELSAAMMPKLKAQMTVEAADGPCCKSCEEPLAKYYSVDVPHGFCGETCMNPSKYWLFKIFESNLTKATDNTPCSEQFTPTGGHYTQYSSTVTHGVPGLLSITLDLFAPVGA